MLETIKRYIPYTQCKRCLAFFVSILSQMILILISQVNWNCTNCGCQLPIINKNHSIYSTASCCCTFFPCCFVVFLILRIGIYMEDWKWTIKFIISLFDFCSISIQSLMPVCSRGFLFIVNELFFKHHIIRTW